MPEALQAISLDDGTGDHTGVTGGDPGADPAGVAGKTFAGDPLVIALGVTSTGEKRMLGIVQTASENKRMNAAFLRELGDHGSRSTIHAWSCVTARKDDVTPGS